MQKRAKVSTEHRVPASLLERLKQTQHAAKHINEATNALNLRIERIESLLQTLNVGVAVSIPLWEDDDNDRSGSVHDELEYAKLGDQWRLIYVTCDLPFSDQPPMRVPLASAPRSIRIAGARRLETLLEALLQEVDSQANRLDNAVITLDQVLESLGGEREHD